MVVLCVCVCVCVLVCVLGVILAVEKVGKSLYIVTIKEGG